MEDAVHTKHRCCCDEHGDDFEMLHAYIWPACFTYTLSLTGGCHWTAAPGIVCTMGAYGFIASVSESALPHRV